MKGNLLLHSDGGSRGNPGPSASAFVAEKNGKLIFSQSKYLGVQTNNAAEYFGVNMALKWLEKYSDQNKVPQVVFYLDSLLITNQLNGIYKIKSESLKKYYLAIKELEKKIKSKITYEHVCREKNKMADLLVNKCLDKNFTYVKTFNK
ncbi:ribonuclease HI family protein [Patescibacteria group bacterium]|nr:ribonuclease HI family protein [Patescibacteria group bacterium]